ncbi:uncharacterized protein Z520_07756 [Fonsecaea multimorphosa CBS 102226]|uniref:Uncharacterized protein n=1 Tax=Fonsecaea multimorphosa CBS 102226 TaxID=1442371 RepID=A0A0D2H3S4_9EURO|nr:uncharacterized protein Z520_07756 [Fonsecaea multimorphosa CBS 102226]KIX96490.1 hypothetical protein Z520_07756 [Fonsecaea multimorphosa CBS 102226]OAL28309.1 hypothetical protein AYO22_03015 [Fonsecaea multimorphosa]
MVHEFPGRFQGKVVAITGGASGVGAALTRRYVAEGAKVLIADLCDVERGQKFADEFPKSTVLFHQCDIGDPAQAAGLVTAAINQLGDLDIVHNNASAFAWGAIPDMDPESWTRVFKVGVDGPFHICRAAISHMRNQEGKKQRGAIINTLSTSGLIGDKGLGAYCAAKAALANLTRAMGIDHAPEGIRVNGVAPGWINTPMSAALSATPAVHELVAGSTPMHRPAEPEEIAAVAMFLASEDASFVTGAGMKVHEPQATWRSNIGGPPSMECRWWSSGFKSNAVTGPGTSGE